MSYMPFGRFRGSPLGDVPTRYPRWLLTVDLYGGLREDVEAELCGRGDDPLFFPPRSPSSGRWRGRPTSPSSPPPPGPDLTGIVRQWCRAMTPRYHPDRGAAHHALIAVDIGYELLPKLIADQAGR